MIHPDRSATLHGEQERNINGALASQIGHTGVHHELTLLGERWYRQLLIVALDVAKRVLVWATLGLAIHATRAAQHLTIGNLGITL